MHSVAVNPLRLTPKPQSSPDSSLLMHLYFCTYVVPYSRKLSPISIFLMPSNALNLRYVSYPLNCISTLMYLVHAASQYKKLVGHSIDPPRLSKHSSYTVRDAYRARIRNVRTGPWRVCKPSSSERAKCQPSEKLFQKKVYRDAHAKTYSNRSS